MNSGSPPPFRLLRNALKQLSLEPNEQRAALRGTAVNDELADDLDHALLSLTFEQDRTGIELPQDLHEELRTLLGKLNLPPSDSAWGDEALDTHTVWAQARTDARRLLIALEAGTPGAVNDATPAIALPLIPPGATGLNTRPHAGLASFKTWAHAAARSLSMSVVEFDTPLVACSFDALQLSSAGDPDLWLLINRFEPIVAATHDRPEVGRAFAAECDYIDLPYFGTTDILVPPAEVLNMPIQSVHVSELPEAELRQVSYFQPERVGDVLFNFWD